MGYFSIRSFAFSCLLILVLATRGNAYVYIVKHNDVLSKIIEKYIPGPVWGKSGSFIKSLSLNPQISNPNLIHPGDQINLPAPERTLSELTTTQKEAATVSETTPKINPEEKKPDDSSGTAFELTPSVSMTSLSAKDLITSSHTTIASNVYVSTDARFIQIWNENFKSYLNLKLSYVSFETPSAPGRTLSGGSKFLTTFGIGGSTNLSPRTTLLIYADLEKDLFTRGVSSTDITVDSVLIPSLGLKLSYDLVKLNAFTLSVAGIYEEKFTAVTDSYTVGHGSLFGGIIGVRPHDIRGDMFQVDLGAYSRAQNTSAISQTETTYSLSLKFFFSLIKPYEPSGDTR